MVGAAIRSILNQTLQPAEIVLSEDGSKDDTCSVMEKLAAIYQGSARLIVLQSAGGAGLLVHINTCVKLADQPWILVFVGDDLSRPIRVARFPDKIRSWLESRLTWSAM